MSLLNMQGSSTFAPVPFVLALSVLFVVNCDEMSPPNTVGWLDPDDIFFESRLKEISRKGSLEKDQSHACHAELQSCIKERESCLKSLKDVNSESECNRIDREEVCSSHHEQSCQKHITHGQDVLYLKRFVNMLLKAIKSSQTLESEVLIYAEVSKAQMDVLEQFGDGNNGISLRLLDETLSDVLAVRSSLWDSVNLGIWSAFNSYISSWESSIHSSEIWSALMCIMVPSFFLLTILKTKSFSRSIYWFLYSTAFTSYIITGLKMIKETSLKLCDTDAECGVPSHLWMTPLAILIRMLGDMFAEISRHGGSAAVIFLSEIHKGFNIFEKTWAIPSAIILAITFSLVILLSLNGGAYNLPFFLGRINFHRPEKPQFKDIPSASQIEERSSSNSHLATHSSIAPLTNNYTFNFGGGEQICDIKKIMDSVSPQGKNQQELIRRETSSIENSIENLEDVKGERLKMCRADVLSSGDTSCLCSEQGQQISDTLKQNQHSSGGVFTFTAPSLKTSTRNDGLNALRGRFKSGKPPTKVLVLERIRHKSL